MLRRSDALTREEECERILSVCGADRIELVVTALDRQFRIIHNRAQLVLGICGVLISTSVVLMTGKLIGRPDFQHALMIRILLAAAGLAEILAAAFVVGGVLNVRWMTQLPGADLRAWLMTSLAYRDGKTRAYRTSILLVLLAMLFYQAAAIMAVVQL